MAQRGQGIGGFPALRDEQRQAARLQHRLAVAELAREIDVGGQAGELLEPVFRDHPGVIARPAGDDGDAVDAGQVEIELRQGDRLVDLADVAAQGLRHHGRLLEDLLLHEVAVIALLDLGGGRARGGDLAADGSVVPVVDLRACAGDHHPVALVQIADLLGQRGKRQRVGPQVGLPLPVSHHQRRAEPRADQHVGVFLEGDRQRKGAAQLRQHGLDRILRGETGLDLFGQQVRHHFGIGIAFKAAPPRGQRIAQLAEVLDDPVMDQGQHPGRVGVGIGRGRRAVGRPAGVGDAGGPRRGMGGEFLHQARQLARRAAAHQLAPAERADPRAVIAAILHPPQAIDQPVRHLFLANDADDAAHG